MKNLLLLFVTLVIVSCNNNDKPDLKKFDWMLGKWRGGNDSVVMHEEWNTLSDTAMDGVGTVTVKGDTTFSENIKLHIKDADIFYQVTGAGNIGVVDFKFTGIVKDTFIFENPAHDFPQKIAYIKTPNGMYVKVDGMDNGMYHKEEFDFNKAK